MASRRHTPGITRRKNKDGRTSYELRWRQGGGREARNLSHTFDREREAIDTRNQILAAGSVCYCIKHAPDGSPASRLPGLLPEEAPLPPALTLGEYAQRHTAALTGVGEGYRRDMLRDVKRHLRGIADKPIDKVTELDVRELIRGMETGSHPWLTKPLSPVTIRRQLAQAGAIMAAAMNDGLVTRNPFRGHRLARVVTTEHKGATFLTGHEWSLIQAALPEGVYRDLPTFMVGSGLRWGEATALHVGDVDVTATPARVHVRSAWKSDGANGWVIGPPKSGRSRRTVPIPDWARDALLAHVAGKATDEFVFLTPRGTPIRPANYWHRHWSPALDKAEAKGLTKRPRVHDLRGTFASWLLAEGVPMTEVSRRLGHSTLAVTDSHYAHLLPGADAAFIAALEKYGNRPS